MSDAIDRAVQAASGILWREDFDGPDASQRELLRQATLAVIGSLREPTKNMMISGYQGYQKELHGGGDSGNHELLLAMWHAMIDEVLK